MNIRVGVIGLGFMGRRYVHVLSRLEGVELRAVCDVRSEVAAEVAQATGAVIFGEATELAASPQVDAVFVCTPEDRHTEAAVAALQAGKPVLIEKPVAHSLGAAAEIAAAAASHGALAMVGHLLRFEPRWAAARQIVESGDLGEVVSISSRRVGNILDQDVLRGRTTIPLYYGVHDLDILRWFAAAEATTIYAARREGRLREAGYDVDDLYVAVVEFANGVLASAELGWHIPPAAVRAPTSGLTVTGAKGWLRIEQGLTGLEVWSESASTALHPALDVTFWTDVWGVPGGALANEVRHFLDCIRRDVQPIITLQDGIEALRLSLAMERSATERRTIRLSEFEVADAS